MEARLRVDLGAENLIESALAAPIAVRILRRGRSRGPRYGVPVRVEEEPWVRRWKQARSLCGGRYLSGGDAAAATFLVVNRVRLAASEQESYDVVIRVEEGRLSEQELAS